MVQTFGAHAELQQPASAREVTRSRCRAFCLGALSGSLVCACCIAVIAAFGVEDTRPGARGVGTHRSKYLAGPGLPPPQPARGAAARRHAPVIAASLDGQPAPLSRRAFAAAAIAAAGAAPALALKTKLPEAYSLERFYPADVEKLIRNMRAATKLDLGDEGRDAAVRATLSQMRAFDNYYSNDARAQGAASFLELQPAIRDLSMHFEFHAEEPVPRNLRRRQRQQFKEIETQLIPEETIRGDFGQLNKYRGSLGATVFYDGTRANSRSDRKTVLEYDPKQRALEDRAEREREDRAERGRPEEQGERGGEEEEEEEEDE